VPRDREDPAFGQWQGDAAQGLRLARLKWGKTNQWAVCRSSLYEFQLPVGHPNTARLTISGF
jgi:hypothetical protein